MKSAELKPTVFIGKNGITEPVISEVKQQLNARKVIKVKVLRSAKEEMDRKGIAEGVADSSGANLVELRGNTFVLSKI